MSAQLAYHASLHKRLQKAFMRRHPGYKGEVKVTERARGRHDVSDAKGEMVSRFDTSAWRIRELPATT